MIIERTPQYGQNPLVQSTASRQVHTPLNKILLLLLSDCSPGGGGGYSLYSDDRDDRHIFLGIVQVKST